MKIYEIGTGYTSIPAKMGAATEIVVEELTSAFQKQGIPVEIIDIKDEKRPTNNLPITEVWVPKYFSGTDVKLGIMHKLKRVVYSVMLAGKLKNILKHSEENVVLHFHNQYNAYFFLKLVPSKYRKKCLIAYTNHSYVWHGEWKEIESTVKARYFQEIYAMQHADVVYVLNKNTEKNLKENIGIAAEKIYLIDNGVNTEVYAPMKTSDIEDFKQKKELLKKKIFLQVGSVCDRKNQLGALKLLKPILKKNDELVYAYVGGIISEEYHQKIREFAKEQGIYNQVRYLGEIQPGSELNKYYNSADVLIFPSKSEGFSLVIIEAMSAGIPVIINEYLSFKLADKCLRYGDNKSFSKIICEEILDSNNVDKIKNIVRSEVVKNYSWDKIASEYYTFWMKKYKDL